MATSETFRVVGFAESGGKLTVATTIPAADASKAIVNALQAMTKFGGAAVLRVCSNGSGFNIHSTYGEVPEGWVESPSK